MNTLDNEDHERIRADIAETAAAGWEPKTSTFRIDLILVSLAMLASLLILYRIVIQARESGLPDQPMTITACPTVLFVEDGSCDGDPPVDPDVLVLSPDLKIPVSGRVMNLSDEDVPYEVTVDWVALESDVRLPTLSVPVTWEAGRNEPYSIEWAPPPTLLQVLETAEPGEDLGQWRIVGTAVPVNRARYDIYQWDSVKTFTLVAPE